MEKIERKGWDFEEVEVGKDNSQIVNEKHREKGMKG